MLVQVLGVIVPLLIAGLTTLRWPTLQRRARAHVELLKEIPVEMGQEFRAAVEEELTELGHRVRRQVVSGADYYSIMLRSSVIIMLISYSAAMSYVLGFFDSRGRDEAAVGTRVRAFTAFVADYTLYIWTLVVLLMFLFGVWRLTRPRGARSGRQEAARRTRNFVNEVRSLPDELRQRARANRIQSAGDTSKSADDPTTSPT